MNRQCRSLLLTAMLLCLLFGQAIAQRPIRTPERVDPDPNTATHTLYGDFKINDSKIDSTRPQNFQVLLYSAMGRLIGRQSVSANGRYYFHNVPSGEYNLAVEMEGSEVTRMLVRLNAIVKSEIRRDIELEWRENSMPTKSNSSAPVSAVENYQRPLVNQKLFDRAQEAITKNDYELAISLLNQVVRADPKDHQAWSSLGLVYFIKEKPADAEKSFRRALEAKPDLKLALQGLGKSQMALKNFDGAIETLTRAAEADPKSAEMNFLLGEAYLQIKKGSKAVGYLNEAIKIDPVGMAEAHLRLGILYRAAGLKEKAVAEFEQFLVKRPNFPDKEKLQQYISENKSK